MVIITDKQFFMDGYLKTNLDSIKPMIKRDHDFVFVIDGPERSGKSCLGQQIAYYLDPGFNLDRVTIGLKEFKEQVATAKPGQALICDESMRMLNSRSAMSSMNKEIVQILAEVGQKNLFLIFILPSFFDLDKYLALWRSNFLIHVYTAKGLERGHFSFFDYQRKKSLYLLGKKMYNYRTVKPNFFGKFPNKYTVDEELYRKKKADSLIDSVEEDLEDDRWYQRFRQSLGFLKRLGGASTEDLARLFSVDARSIQKWCKEVQEPSIEVIEKASVMASIETRKRSKKGMVA